MDRHAGTKVWEKNIIRRKKNWIISYLVIRLLKRSVHLVENDAITQSSKGRPFCEFSHHFIIAVRMIKLCTLGNPNVCFCLESKAQINKIIVTSITSGWWSISLSFGRLFKFGYHSVQTITAFTRSPSSQVRLGSWIIELRVYISPARGSDSPRF